MQVLYHGPCELVLPFFEGLGFACPERRGVADFLQEVTTISDQHVSHTALEHASDQGERVGLLAYQQRTLAGGFSKCSPCYYLLPLPPTSAPAEVLGAHQYQETQLHLGSDD